MADSRFLLVDSEGTTLYESAPDAKSLPLPEWDGQSEWMMEKGTYYFFEKGARSGLTYVSVIPHKELNQSISRMNWMAVLLFAATLLIGILASWVSPEKSTCRSREWLRVWAKRRWSYIKEYCRIQRHFQPSEGFAA